MVNHQNNFATNLTSGVNGGDTTSPLNSIPTISAPFYLAFDATNINGNYEIVKVTSKTATNVNHAVLSYAHTTAEEVRMVLPAEEMDAFQSGIAQGWVPVTDSWAYASASTITVPSGAASIYQKGDKIKLTQTTVKYFYVTAVADTLLTITGGTDYTLVSAAISAISYSHQNNPLGFPAGFILSAEQYLHINGSQATITGITVLSCSSGAQEIQKSLTFGITFGVAPVVSFGGVGPGSSFSTLNEWSFTGMNALPTTAGFTAQITTRTGTWGGTRTPTMHWTAIGNL